MTPARTYLDWNATAPLRPEARTAMLAALDLPGNPSSVHFEGRQARRVIEDARERIAALLGVGARDVVFTSGATESNNMVLHGGWDTIFVAGIEHESVLRPSRNSGARIVDIPVGRDGRVEPEAFADQFARTDAGGRRLAVLQTANNETGVVQPVAELAAIARDHGIFVHTDAVQSIGREALDAGALDVHYVSFSAHKFGGPKGIGALVARNGAPLQPLLTGGGQERRQRAGTESLANIAGFGAAAEASGRDLALVRRLAALRDDLEAGVRRATPQSIVIGADAPRLANTSLIALPGRAAETLVAALDLAGVAVSAGSACSSGKVTESHVLKAMGLDSEVTRSAIRMSLGTTTEARDIAAFLAAWTSIAGSAARAA